jgi:uncharacterized protein
MNARAIPFKRWGICRPIAIGLWALRVRYTQKGIPWHRKIRFFARLMLHFTSSNGWFALIKTTPLRTIAVQEPCFLDIIHRPFVDRRLNPLTRLELLSSHYHYFYKVFEPHIAKSVMQGQGWCIGSVEAKSPMSFDIVLRRIGQFDKEGCLSLVFMQATQALLMLTFSFVRINASSVHILIGGIQGGRDSKEAIKSATHAMHGLQPRLLLMQVFRDIATHLNISAIYAVNQDNHVYKSDRYAHRKNIQINYDELWALAQGKQQANGHFSLPIQLPHIPLADRASRKRAQYRLRNVMMQGLGATLKANLERLRLL